MFVFVLHIHIMLKLTGQCSVCQNAFEQEEKFRKEEFSVAHHYHIYQLANVGLDPDEEFLLDTRTFEEAQKWDNLDYQEAYKQWLTLKKEFKLLDGEDEDHESFAPNPVDIPISNNPAKPIYPSCFFKLDDKMKTEWEVKHGFIPLSIYSPGICKRYVKRASN